MIGAHNTFTYLKPLKWWMYIFIPFAKCQRRLVDTYNLYDIRIKQYKDIIYVSHGPVLYKKLTEILPTLKDESYCRILLEGKFSKEQLDNLQKYIDSFNKIKFVCGRDKNTWEKRLNIEDLDNLEQYVGSMQSWYGKICPFLYYLFNKKKLLKYRKEVSTNKHYLFDFI